MDPAYLEASSALSDEVNPESEVSGTFYPLPEPQIFHMVYLDHPDNAVPYGQMPVCDISLGLDRVDIESAAPLLKGLQTVLLNDYADPSGLDGQPQVAESQALISWLDLLRSFFYDGDEEEAEIIWQLDALIQAVESRGIVYTRSTKSGFYRWVNGVYFKDESGFYGKGAIRTNCYKVIYPDSDSKYGWSMYKIYYDQQRKGVGRLGRCAKTLIPPKVFPTGQFVSQLPKSSPLHGTEYDGRVVEADMTFAPYTDLATAHDPYAPTASTARVYVAIGLDETGAHVAELYNGRGSRERFEVVEVIKGTGSQRKIRLKTSSGCLSTYYLSNPSVYTGGAIKYL